MGYIVKKFDGLFEPTNGTGSAEGPADGFPQFSAMVDSATAQLISSWFRGGLEQHWCWTSRKW